MPDASLIVVTTGEGYHPAVSALFLGVSLKPGKATPLADLFLFPGYHEGPVGGPYKGADNT